MSKIICILGFVLLFSLGAYAQETLTITTYYPSPSGSYNQLQANSLGVGDNDNNGVLDIGDVPVNAGDVWIRGNVGIGTTAPASQLDVAGGVRLGNDAAACNAAKTGTLRYNAGLQICDGTAWLPLSTVIIGAQDLQTTGPPYAGLTGTQACTVIGRTCSRVISHNFIKVDANCPGATHCARVCSGWYNQGLAGVDNGLDRDNIHSCNALVGEYATYIDPGVVQCNAYFSAICN